MSAEKQDGFFSSHRKMKNAILLALLLMPSLKLGESFASLDF